MALLNSLKTVSFFTPISNRPFHFLGPKADLNLFRALPDVRKMTEPNDYFTRHGDGTPISSFGRPIVDSRLTDKMISMPKPPASYKLTIPSSAGPTTKASNKHRSTKRVRVCSNRSGRTIVKPVRVPIVIDIQNMKKEEPKYTPPPPVQLTLRQRFISLSKDAAWALFAHAKRGSMTQLRKITKIRAPKWDAQKMKKYALVGTPLVTALFGYVYGRRV